MLVVTVIITILIAILLPVLKDAKRATYQSICANNFHQFGIALSVYAQDHEDWLPIGKYNIPTNIMEGGIYYLANDYGVARETFICPEYPESVPGRRYTQNVFPGDQDDEMLIPYWYYGGEGYFQYPNPRPPGVARVPHYTADDGDPWMGWRITAWTQRSEYIRPTPKTTINLPGAEVCPVSWDSTYDVDDLNASGQVYGLYRSRHSNHTDEDGFTGRGFNMLYLDLHVRWHRLVAGIGEDQFANGHYR